LRRNPVFTSLRALTLGKDFFVVRLLKTLGKDLLCRAFVKNPSQRRARRCLLCFAVFGGFAVRLDTAFPSIFSLPRALRSLCRAFFFILCHAAILCHAVSCHRTANIGAWQRRVARQCLFSP
jgi:hypothetical protein